MRIAVGGLHTECSTYNPVLMQAADFRQLRGADLLAHPEFAPLAAFPVTWLPTLHVRAVPGGPIARHTYDAFKAEFLERLAAFLPLDGLYLAMHGAATVQGLDDAEGDWIAAARAVVGPDCPIAASYDLHGNVSRAVIDALDMFAAYRTAPHVDVDETKTRAVAMLVRAITDGVRPALAWAPVPLLLPGERTSTTVEPGRGLYAGLAALDARAGVWEAALMVGYVWADQPRATACAVVTGTDAAAIRAAAETLAGQYWAARHDFGFGQATGDLAALLDRAAAATAFPVILADSGDNPTGGGVGDRADVLAAVLERGTEAAVAGIVDRPATEACFAAGVGAKLLLRIGASLDPAGSAPLTVQAEVLHLAHGAPAERQALVRVGKVRVALTARRRPFHSFADFAAVGLDPRAERLVAVKSGYLSPDLASIAAQNLMALTPGVVDQDIARLPIQRIPRPCFPWDQDFPFSPRAVLSARATGGAS